MKTLVTGLGGFTGRYLQAELASNGHEVVGLSSDLTDATMLDDEMKRMQPEWVVHLAAISFVGHGDPNDFYRVNLTGTRNLLSALAGCGKQPDCVVLASSANVYGNSSEGVLNECAALNPANDYAVSKLSMEHMARLWLDQLPIVITRPFNYTGVGQREVFLLPKIVDHFRRKAKLIELGNLDICRDFSDIRTVVWAYRRLLEECPVGKTFNISSGRTHSLRDILGLMREITDFEMDVYVNPAFVRPNEIKTLCGDPSQLRKLIGDWEPLPLEETLRWMFLQ